MVITFPYKTKTNGRMNYIFPLRASFPFLRFKIFGASQISINYLIIIATFLFSFENQIVVSFSEISIEFPILIYTY